MNDDRPGSRRKFLWQAAGAGALLTLGGAARASTPAVTVENFSTAGKSLGTVSLPKVVKTDAQWRKQLTASSYEITRREGTEAPFSGKYANNHAAGLYRCICCETALFDAATKFESGTGWPSFYQPISRHNANETVDNTLGMRRTAVSCSLCNAHLGHVFDDGPKPTGLRYCMNSVALNFVARAQA